MFACLSHCLRDHDHATATLFGQVSQHQREVWHGYGKGLHPQTTASFHQDDARGEVNHVCLFLPVSHWPPLLAVAEKVMGKLREEYALVVVPGLAYV